MTGATYQQVASQECDGGDVELAERGGPCSNVEEESCGDDEERNTRSHVVDGDEIENAKNGEKMGVVVRVLDVKNQGATVAVRVNPDGRVEDLQIEIESALEVPVGQQRLICSGRQMAADEKLSRFKIGENLERVTIHLMRRPSEAERDAVVASSSGGQNETSTTVNPLRTSDLDALSLALDAQRERHDAEESVTRRIARETGRSEATIRAAARVRLLSSLLALYCAMNSLACLSLQNVDPAQSRNVLELGLNFGGLAVGYQGLTASRTLDLASAERYDRSLRLFSLAMLSYEAYYHVILPSNDLNDLGDSNNNDSSEFDDFQTDPPQVINTHRGGDNSENSRRNSTSASPDPDDILSGGDEAFHDNYEDPYHDITDDEDVLMSRDSQILSGIIVLTLWSGIWLICVQNAARLRLDIQAHELGLPALDDGPLPNAFVMA